MKISTLYKLWFSLVMVLALSACNSKTTQGETNSTAIDNPMTQTERNTSSDRENTTVADGTKNDGTSGKTTVSPNVKNPSVNRNPSTGAGNGGHGTEGTSQNTTTQSGGANNTADHITSDEDGDSNTHADSDNSTTNDNGTNTSTGSDDNSTQTDNNTGTGEEGNTTTDGNDTNVTTGGDDNSTQTDSNTTTGGEETNTTTGDNNSTDTNTTTPIVTLASLNLTVDKTSLNKDENTTVKVIATYSDNSSKEVTDKVEWVVVPNNAVKMTNVTLTALQDKATTVKAKLKGKTSNAIDLNITWVVNGHTLPLEPDPQVNNATLLGVDVNDNGVRDDVERWIYKNYEHPIERGIFMQSARANTSLLSTKPMHHQPNKNIQNVTSCQFYWIYKIKPSPFNKYELYEHDDEVDKLQFNTVKRLVAKRKYEMSLSGGVYSLIPAAKEKCEFNENGNLKAQQ